jgi:hypothetical protein
MKLVHNVKVAAPVEAEVLEVDTAVVAMEAVVEADAAAMVAVVVAGAAVVAAAVTAEATAAEAEETANQDFVRMIEQSGRALKDSAPFYISIAPLTPSRCFALRKIFPGAKPRS